jgi:hypothetical protein
VTDTYVVANSRSSPFISAVNNGAILDIYFIANTDTVDISPDDRLKPDTTIIAHNGVTNEGSIIG